MWRLNQNPQWKWKNLFTTQQSIAVLTEYTKIKFTFTPSTSSMIARNVSTRYMFLRYHPLSPPYLDHIKMVSFFFYKILDDFNLFIFIYLWLCWVFVSAWGLSLVEASGGHSSSRCAGLSLSRPLLSWSTGSRRAGSVIVAHGPSRSAACGIFPDQGSNPCALHWQADSQPLRHQGSPNMVSWKFKYKLL